jgi:hypothetical protein
LVVAKVTVSARGFLGCVTFTTRTGSMLTGATVGAALAASTWTGLGDAVGGLACAGASGCANFFADSGLAVGGTIGAGVAFVTAIDWGSG